MRTENQVHIRIAPAEFVHIGLFLHHAAADRNFHRGIGLLIVAGAAESSVKMLVGIIAHCACVKDYEIRALVRSLRKTGIRKHTGELLCVPRVHLAAEIGDMVRRCAAELRFQFPCILLVSLKKFLLPRELLFVSD